MRRTKEEQRLLLCLPSEHIYTYISIVAGPRSSLRDDPRSFFFFCFFFFCFFFFTALPFLVFFFCSAYLLTTTTTTTTTATCYYSRAPPANVLSWRGTEAGLQLNLTSSSLLFSLPPRTPSLRNVISISNLDRLSPVIIIIIIMLSIARFHCNSASGTGRER